MGIRCFWSYTHSRYKIAYPTGVNGVDAPKPCTVVLHLCINPLRLKKKIVTGKYFPTPAAIIAEVLLFFAVLRIFFHYSEYDFFELFLLDVSLRLLILLFAVVWVVVRIVKRKPLYTITIELVITLAGFCLIYLVLSPKKLDEADWKINFTRRQKIVAVAKAGKLKQVEQSGWYNIPDSLHLFPFIKEQQVVMSQKENSAVTITFYTERGLLDHYSAFIYTDYPEDVTFYDDKTKNDGISIKLAPNWYQIIE